MLKDKLKKYLLRHGRIKLVLLIVVGCLAALGTGFDKIKDAREKPLPNIVLIVADDLGYGDLGCYGATKIETPHIDDIAAHGIRFTDAHSASSLCSPSRYAIMTGRYPWRTRLKKGVVAPFERPLIDPGRMTVASLLKSAGYYTASVGKWHLGFNWTFKPGEKIAKKDRWKVEMENKVNFDGPLTGGPVDLGFDYYYGIPGSLNMFPYVLIENGRVTQKPAIEKVWYDTDFKGALRAPNWNTTTMGAKLTEKAVSLIYRHFRDNKKQPLFLYFPTEAIHRPCLPNFTKDSSGAGLRGDMVEQFDWTVGRIMHALKQTGELNNTLLIITSDNGPRPGDPVAWFKQLEKRPYGKTLLPELYSAHKYKPALSFHAPGYGAPWMIYDHHAADGFRGFKSDPWEGGHRIPFIVYWPDKIKAGKSSGQMLCLTDLLASFADLTGQSLPSDAGEDSEDMLAAILGKANKSIRKTMVVVSAKGDFTIRLKDWKLIEVNHMAKTKGGTHYPAIKDNVPELYNLKKDPGEDHNVFTGHMKLVKEMRMYLRQYKKQGFSAGRLEK